MNTPVRIVRACIFAVLVTSSQARAARTSANRYLERPMEWFRGDQARAIAENLLSYQAPLGGWPKNIDTATAPYTGNVTDLDPTFDNGATTDELRYMARMAVATKQPRYEQSFLRGLDYILKAQYANGGWPQSYPPDESYHRYITFNDGAMARLMFFIKEVAEQELYSFVDADRRHACSEAFDRGVQCILKCQVRVDGKLTVWCAQHDEKDLTPKMGRLFEPMSLSGSETVGIVHVLMSLEHPSPEVIASVDAAVAWLDSVKIPGIRVEDRPYTDGQRGFERYVIEDPAAPPMWARFYEIGSNRAIFSDRDSVIKYKLSEIGHERRTGYAWLKYWPKNLIEKEYPAWRAKLGLPPSLPATKPSEGGLTGVH